MSCRSFAFGAIAISAAIFASGSAFAQGYANATIANVQILEGLVDKDTFGNRFLLSPDGTRLLHMVSSEFCLFDVTTVPASELSCDKLERSLGSTEDLFWSPGGTRLVLPTFSNAILAFRDTDIVLLDPKTWTETNLSDDGFDDYLSGGVSAQWDMGPRWLDDNTLMFVRYEVPEAAPGVRGLPALMRADIGGEITEVFSPLARATALVYGLAVSPDGKQAAFVFDFPDSPKENGVHILEIGGKASRRLVTVDNVGGLHPFGMSFSADGKYLLTLREHPEQNAGTIAAVINLESGAVSHIVAPERTVYGVAWSPTGSALAYVAANPGDGPDDPGGLYIADPPDQAGRLVLAGPYEPPQCCGNQPFPWASNDTMVLGNQDEPEKSVLVQLQR